VLSVELPEKSKRLDSASESPLMLLGCQDPELSNDQNLWMDLGSVT